MPITACHRDLIGVELRVCFEKALFDDGRCDADRFGYGPQKWWSCYRCIGVARCGVILLCQQPRATAVLAPLIPGEAGGAHDVRHLSGHAPRRRAHNRLTKLGVALFELRPEPVQDPAVIVTWVALVCTPCVTFKGTPVRRPAQRHDVVVEALRRRGKRQNREQ